MAYSTDDKRKDLIYKDRVRIEQVYSFDFFRMMEKLNESETHYNNLNTRRVNKEWDEMMNPDTEKLRLAEFETPTPRTDEEMQKIMQQSGKAGLMG